MYPPKISIITLGCRANQAESIELSKKLIPNFPTVLDEIKEDIDVYILNTCTVTSKADRDVRKHIGRILKKLKQDGILIITGCFVNVHKDNLVVEDPRILWLDNYNKDEIPKILESRFLKDRLLESCDNRIFDKESFRIKARIPIMIQNGCIHNCSYCIIPYARGKVEWSMDLNEILIRTNFWAEHGINEVIFTGINLGRWGRNLDPPLSLAELVTKLEEESKIYRFRFSSIEPWCIDERLISVLKHSKKFCRHLHIPVQHGTDTILKLMHRPYSTTYIKELFNLLIEELQGIVIGSDVIVGFPSEDKLLFEESFGFFEKLPITYLHVFSFSPRPFTKYEGRGVVDVTTIKERVKKLRELSKSKRFEVGLRYYNKVVEVVSEKKDSQIQWIGTTREYFTVNFLDKNRKIKAGDIVFVKIKEVKDEGVLVGELLDE